MAADEDYLGKLHALHELTNKHQVVNSIHPRIVAAYKALQSEEKFAEQCIAEKKLLEEERQVHVETIRQINKDIEDVTTVEKRSEENRRNLTKNLNDLLEEYLPVKDHVDRLRSSLELEKLPDLSEDGVQVPPGLLVKLDHHPHIPLPSNSDFCAFHPVYSHMHQPQSNVPTSLNHPPGMSICDTPAFRQKPPPMKKCPTCANDIHRNAPICPICKSKSHSKNPKKSKKKAGS